MNNALNGAVVNLEVVRLRARPGADAAASAPFAETAAGELERSAGLVGALLALTRLPRPGAVTDVRDAFGQVATLLGPGAAQRGVTLEVDAGAGAMGTAAPLTAVRLGVAAALMASVDLVESRPAVELAGLDPADEPRRRLRCTLRLDPGPTLRIHGDGASLAALALADSDTSAVLRAVGLDLAGDGDALALRCPPA